MTRTTSIIERVRDTLADLKAERWSDAQLLRLLDEGQKAVARHFELLKDMAELNLNVGQYIYDLPTDLWRLLRISHNDCPLELLSYYDMDEKYSCGWEKTTGPYLEAAVIDNREIQKLRVYPIPDDTLLDPEAIVTVPYGVLVANGFVSTNQPEGVSAKSLTDQVALKELFGVVSESDTTNNALIFYVRDPKDIVEATDELELPVMFDTALKHYVIGHAFLNDLDTQYQQKAGTHISMYEKEVARLGSKANQHNGTRAITPGPTYRGFV